MSATVAAPPRFDLGRVISRAFVMIGQRPVSLVVIAFGFGALPALATGWATLQLAVPATATPDLGASFTRLGLLEGAVFLATGLGWVAQGASAIALLGDDGARPLATGEIVARLAAKIVPLYVVGVIASLAIGVATLLLIVPGVLLSLAWTVGPQATALESRGFFGGLGRSLELTRNHRGILFVLALIYGVVSAVVSFAVRLIFGAGFSAGIADPIYLTYGAQPVMTGGLTLLVCALNVSAYQELRELKEGGMTHQVAALFS